MTNQNQTSLIELQNFNLKSLGRRADLGTQFNFEEVIPTATIIQSYSNQLDAQTVATFPEKNQSEIIQICTQILGRFKSIESFDVTSDRATQTRNTTISQISTMKDQMFNIVLKYKSLMPFDIRESFEDFNILDEIKTAKKESSRLLNESNLLRDALREITSEESQSRKNARSKMDKEISDLSERFAEKSAELTTSLDSLNEGLKVKSEAAKTEILENLKLKEARELWGTKRTGHLVAYTLTGIILLTALVGLPVMVMYNLEAIAVKLDAFSRILTPSDPTSTNWAIALSSQLTKLLIIGLPVTAIVWLLRILLRVFLSNRALMDDAHQRRVMLDTYLYLVGQNTASVEGRPIVLNALFRPSPGQMMDIEPPNIGDVVRMAQKKLN